MYYKINKTLSLALQRQDFRKTKNGSLYLNYSKDNKLKIVVRISNHFKKIYRSNEKLCSYVYKNEKDFFKIIKRLNKKFNLNIVL